MLGVPSARNSWGLTPTVVGVSFLNLMDRRTTGPLSWTRCLPRARLASSRVSNICDSTLRVLVPSAAVRRCHKQSSLKQHKFIMTISRGGQQLSSISAGHRQEAGGWASFLDALGEMGSREYARGLGQL